MNWRCVCGVVIAIAVSLEAADVPQPASFRGAIAKAKPAVVCIIAARTPGKVLGDSLVGFVNPFPLRTFPTDALRLAVNLPLTVLFPFDRKAMGSGFIISGDGYVITNLHVVERANKVKVELPSRKTYKARIVGEDPFADIALLKLDVPEDDPLPVLPMGNSDDLHEGDWVIAIGSPFGLKWTSTAGIVSAMGRNIGATMIDDLIQIEASLDSGNSGGPLVNANGEAVGINTAALFLAENKGFAVPINMVKEILPDLMEHGRPRRGWLGVVSRNLTPEIARKKKLPVEQGSLVCRTFWGSPARRSGLRPGDVVVRYDGQAVTDTRSLARLARRTQAGRKVTVRIYRKKATKTIEIPVGEMKKRLQIF